MVMKNFMVFSYGLNNVFPLFIKINGKVMEKIESWFDSWIFMSKFSKYLKGSYIFEISKLHSTDKGEGTKIDFNVISDIGHNKIYFSEKLLKSMIDYKTRFIREEHSHELVNLYHLARTALADKPFKEQSKYDRMIWAKNL